MKTWIATAIVLAALDTTAAHASDRLANAPTMSAVSNWNGFFIGGHVGGVIQDSTWRQISFSPTTDFLFKDAGPLVGLHGGYNFQAGNWVLGVEAAYSWSRLRDRFVLSPSNWYDVDVDSVATFVGRIGRAWDHWHVYLTGGYALARVDALSLGGGLPGRWSFGGTDDGWTVGAGIEYMLPNNFSFGLDYKYVLLKGDRSGLTGLAIPVSFDTETRLHMATLRLTYKFGSQ